MANIRSPFSLAIISFFLTLASLALAVESGYPPITPPAGSPERKLIMDALRVQIREFHKVDVVFVIKHLKIKDDWTWVHALPQSPDLENQYEDVAALLRKHGPAWEVVELACSEEDNDQCLPSAEYFNLLKQRFPGLPPDILPHESEEGTDPSLLDNESNARQR